MKKEISWINTVKFLCIILIYLYHAEFYCGLNDSAMPFFYLPFFTNSFFIVSGYLLFKKQLSEPLVSCDSSVWYRVDGGGKSLLSNILFKIAIPSIVFSTLIYFPKRILRGDGVDIMSFSHDTLLGGSLWFTCALTVAELIAFIVLLARVRNVWWQLAIGVVLIVFANTITHSGFQIFESNKIPWQYKSGLIAFFYLTCGGLYWKYEQIIDRILHKSRSLMILGLVALWCGLTGLLIFTNNYEGLRLINKQLTTGAVNVPSVLWAVLTVFMVINICKLWNGCALTTWVGRNSIAFYFFCGAVPNFVTIACIKIIPQTDHVLLAFLVWGLSLPIAFGVVYLFSKYLPWAFDFRKLTRK